MFNYTRKMQLALKDKLRRGGLAAGAGVMLLVAAGFLLAALWTWLADGLGWGPLLASLTIGAVFLVIGLVLLSLAGRERHPAPDTDELREEIAERVEVMADAAIGKVSGMADEMIGRASEKARRIVGGAGQKAQAFSDQMSYEADRFADRAEAGAEGAARQAREAVDAGLGAASRAVDDLAGRTQSARASDGASNGAAVAPLIGAFAVGLTLASRLRRNRRDDDRRS